MGATEEGADSSPLRSGRASHESTSASGAIVQRLREHADLVARLDRDRVQWNPKTSVTCVKY